jgi:hypothetical protein
VCDVSRGATAAGETPLGVEHPAEITVDGILCDRLGIDEDGTAFYAADSARSVLLTSVDADGRHGSVERVPPDALADLLELVEWREVDQSLLSRAGGERYV